MRLSPPLPLAGFDVIIHGRISGDIEGHILLDVSRFSSAALVAAHVAGLPTRVGVGGRPTGATPITTTSSSGPPETPPGNERRYRSLHPRLPPRSPETPA